MQIELLSSEFLVYIPKLILKGLRRLVAQLVVQHVGQLGSHLVGHLVGLVEVPRYVRGGAEAVDRPRHIVL